IAASEAEIDAIVNNTEAPSFTNVIEAMAYAGEALDNLSNIFFNLNSAETNDDIQKIAQDVAPLLSEHASKIAQNTALFEKIKAVYDKKAQYNLNDEQEMLLNETYKGFVRSGALLDDAQKKQLEQISKELSLKSLQFG